MQQNYVQMPPFRHDLVNPDLISLPKVTIMAVGAGLAVWLGLRYTIKLP
jgi:hypothetical protein